MKTSKKYDTGLRILEVLKVLLEESVTKNELIEKLRTNNKIECVYTQEAFLKYFNTLKLSGININRNKTKYYIENTLIKIDFSKEEKQALVSILKNKAKLNNKEEEELINNIILKLNKYTDNNLNKDIESIPIIKNESEKDNLRQKIISTLKNMLYDKHNVIITYEKQNHTEDKIIVEIREILEQNNNIYVLCYNQKIGRNKRINIDSIKSIKQLPTKTQGISHMNSVVFEIYGRLAYSYKLKPSEKVIDFNSSEHITISNSEEDKESLLLRLLKYGENCKILKPSSVQEEFIQLTDNIIKNLEFQNEKNSIHSN